MLVRPRIEKSSSRRAASRLASVCSGTTTRVRTEAARPNSTVRMTTVSVHWTFGVYGSVHKIHNAVTAPGTPAPMARRKIC